MLEEKVEVGMVKEWKEKGEKMALVWMQEEQEERKETKEREREEVGLLGG